LKFENGRVSTLALATQPCWFDGSNGQKCRCLPDSNYRGDFMDALNEAKETLQRLAESRSQIESDLAQAIDNADADAAINLRKLLTENSVRHFAQISRVIRLEEQLSKLDREQALITREELEEKFSDAARQVESAQKRLQDAWEEHQRIGVQLFALDQKIETERQNINEKQQALIDRTVRWKQEAHLIPLREAACDL